MKIVSIVGARPQLVKAAIMAQSLRQHPEVEHVLVHTGQHYDQNMSGVFFDELDIPAPAHNLGVGSGGHGAQTGRMLEGLEKLLIEEPPDWVVVYGDTNSTLAGTLAACKLHIPVAHVEAGLRSFNRHMPEEINRIVADQLATQLFAPTENAAANLQREGIGSDRVHVVGDLMYDAALQYAEAAAGRSRLPGVQPREYILATLHRAENTNSDGRRLTNILRALNQLSRTLAVVLPLHPRTRAALRNTGGEQLLDGLCTTEPVGYLDMLTLEKNARLIATDSGGVQKEAFFFHVPCVTLREETEWTELVEAGWNRLAPPRDAETIIAGIETALREQPQPFANPYGDGHSAEKILAKLLQ